MYANSECVLKYMRLCRILYMIHMFLTRRLRLIFTPKFKLIIFNQGILVYVLPILCIGSTTLFFKTPPKQNAQDRAKMLPAVPMEITSMDMEDKY